MCQCCQEHLLLNAILCSYYPFRAVFRQMVQMVPIMVQQNSQIGSMGNVLDLKHVKRSYLKCFTQQLYGLQEKILVFMVSDLKKSWKHCVRVTSYQNEYLNKISSSQVAQLREWTCQTASLTTDTTLQAIIPTTFHSKMFSRKDQSNDGFVLFLCSSQGSLNSRQENLVSCRILFRLQPYTCMSIYTSNYLDFLY